MTTTVASLQAIFTANTSDFDAGVGRVRAGLSGVGEAVGGTLQRVGGGMQSAGAKIALGIAPLVAFGAQGIKTATQFDSAMAEISARTGLVGEDLAAIEQYALDMGAATVFSAQESADAFLQLLTSGQSVEEAIATLPFVLDAAAASGADLGQTADLLTDIMAAYGLGVEHAEAVTNALAQAAGASSADINSLGQGFANVGPIASAYGLSVEQTAAVLAILSENGIKGAEAGTALKSMLLNMTRPTAEVAAAWEELGVSFYDAEGNARDIGLVIGELDAALDGLPIEEQNRLMYELAGSYGIVALQALRGEISIEEMMEMMNEQATAAEVAEARMDTFAGAMDELGGAVETLMIKAFRPFMNNTLKPLAREVAGMVNRVADWAAAHPRLITAVGLLVGGLAALSTVLIVGGGIISFFGVALGALLSPIGLV
ncbi:MAG: phage tail tape measure protein, partial [Chloroflexi bacterium]|nr:phage tail tape measure protein [Chloroflexota bacterium]